MNLLSQTQGLHFSAPLPSKLFAVEQRFEAPVINDIAAATSAAVAEARLIERIRKPGASVAIGVGSRGISNIVAILRTVVTELRAAGLSPFITPAMGSHGAATAEGQIAVLKNLGISEESVDAEVRATMEVKQIGQLPGGGPPLFQDLVSAAAGYTILVNRIKPHTSFRSTVESGLAKMAAIGIGKQRGAEVMHSMGVEGLRRHLAPAARIYQQQSNLIGGVAIVENAYHQTAIIAGLTADEVGGTRESQLLKRAKALMPSLPFTDIDVLVVREMGKNISGTGMDTNIINRLNIPGQPDPDTPPHITIIAVLDLSAETHGNCTGLGLANVTTARLVQKIDWAAFYTNALTSGILNMARASLPITMADDERAIQAAVRGCGRADQEDARVVFVQNTLALDRLWISPSLRRAANEHPALKITGEAALEFASAGTMLSPWSMSATHA